MSLCKTVAVLRFVLATLWIAAATISSPAHAVAARAPQRVVSLAPSVTETVFALGYGHLLVGVTSHCDYPAAARKITLIGSFLNPSIETIIARRPDLVIGVSSATDPMKAREMERIGLKVTLISLASVSDILHSIKSVARLLGDSHAGEKLADQTALRLEAIRRRVAPAPRRRTLLAVGVRPLVAVGGKNFIDELISLAGGENIAGGAAQPWLNLPDEYIVAKAPQVIIEAGMGREREAAAKHWSDLKSIPAVKERRVYSHPSDKILRPGPRIGEGLEEIARLIHPECFTAAKSSSHRGNPCERPRP